MVWDLEKLVAVNKPLGEWFKLAHLNLRWLLFPARRGGDAAPLRPQGLGAAPDAAVEEAAARPSGRDNDLKQKLRQKPQPGSKDELTRNTRAVLRAIQRSPARIKAYFKPQPVRYAA